jgi:AcrR family transcriptional regulator
MTSPVTARDRAKAERSDALLHAAARLFAERGYTGVSLEDIGAAVGVSGPAVYRHFAGKQALLGAVLVKVSQDLIHGGEQVSELATTPEERMQALIRFHVDFALRNAEVIQVQDRDVAHLSDADRAEVRRLQRAYIELWMAALSPLHSSADPGAAHGVDREELRLRVQACFGLINSTPHSTRAAARRHTATATVLTTATVLIAMADAALRAAT